MVDQLPTEGSVELDAAVALTKAPAWVSSAVAYFKSVSSSSKWVELVNEWVSFEAELSFPTAVRMTFPSVVLGIFVTHFQSMPRLSPTHRPDVVRAWFRCGHKYASPPSIKSLPLYIEAWWAWWRALQPEWRQAAGDTALHSLREADQEEKWECTCIGGPNGMFTVILTVAWWIAELDGKTEDNSIMALDDVKWVLSEMIKNGAPNDEDLESSGKKRSAPSAPLAFKVTKKR